MRNYSFAHGAKPPASKSYKRFVITTSGDVLTLPQTPYYYHLPIPHIKENTVGKGILILHYFFGENSVF